MKLLLFSPSKKTPGERSVPDKSDFSSPLCVFLGCSSGLCFTPRSNSGQPFPALHPLEPPRCPGDGQAGLGLCLVQVEAADRAQSFVYHKSVLLSTCLIPGVCDFAAAEPCGCDLLIPNNSNWGFCASGSVWLGSHSGLAQPWSPVHVNSKV